MKHLICFLLGIILLSSCYRESQEHHNYEITVDGSIRELYYIYEIHTVSGICDTVKSHEPVSVVLTGNVTNVICGSTRYMYVDRFRMLTKEIKVIK